MNEAGVEIAVFKAFEPGQINWLGLGRRSAIKNQYTLVCSGDNIRFESS